MADQMTKTELKQIIKCLLIAISMDTASVNATISTIQEDFEEMIGIPVPFLKFGYNSVEDLLKSIPDTCVVEGTKVYLVNSKKSGYKNALVTSQIDNANINQNVQSMNTIEVKAGTSQPHKTSSQLNKDKLFAKNSKFSYIETGSSTISAETRIIAPPSEFRDITTTSAKEKIENWFRDLDQIAPGCDEIFEPSENEETELSEFDKLREDMHEDLSRVPARVQDRLKSLIKEFPEGIWVSDLPEQYRIMFGKELSFALYGYTSLIEMCAALRIFNCVRPGKDDFILYDKSKPLPVPDAALYKLVASYDIGEKNETVKNRLEALPELDWWDFRGHIPEDAFRLGKTIPKQFSSEIARKKTIKDVVVVKAYNPSKFWIHLGTLQDVTDLDRLMGDIQNFYALEAERYAVPPGLMKVNLYCVHLIRGVYYRALIGRVYQEEEHVEVYCIDYGGTVRVPFSGLWLLHNKFSELPAQAIRCSLANIVPTVKGHPWSRIVNNRFRELIIRRKTKIDISDIDDEQLYVFLADVADQKKLICINDVLVKEKHALWVEEVINGVHYDVYRARLILARWQLGRRRAWVLERRRKRLSENT